MKVKGLPLIANLNALPNTFLIPITASNSEVLERLCVVSNGSSIVRK